MALEQHTEAFYWEPWLEGDVLDDETNIVSKGTGDPQGIIVAVTVWEGDDRDLPGRRHIGTKNITIPFLLGKDYANASQFNTDLAAADSDLRGRSTTDPLRVTRRQIINPEIRMG